MDRQQELNRIARLISRCPKCKEGKSGLPVPGEGDPRAKLMFIGEAPGRKEADTGRPFVGRSGMLLTRYLTEVGIDRSKVFITSPVKYYPGPRAPTPSEIAHGKTHLLAQIKAIKPELIVLLGATAMKTLLTGKFQVTKMHGGVISEGDLKFYITFHPAAALRFPSSLANKLRDDFKKLKKLLPKYSS